MPFKSKARKGKLMLVRAESDSSETHPEPEDQIWEQFVSPRALDRFTTCTSSRALHMEKGFVYARSSTLGYPDFVHSVIERHAWQTFCHRQPVAVTELVRKFYANYNAATPESVFVRDHWVPLTSTEINIMYNLPDTKDHF